MIEIINDVLALYKKNRFEEAKLICEQALIKYPEDFRIINLLGVLYFKLQKYDEAIILNLKAIKINPNHSSLYNNLGLTYKQLEKYKDAIINIKKAIEINPNYAEAYNNLGTIFKELNQFEEAHKYYNKAIMLNPSYSEAYLNLGLLYRDIKKYEESITCFTKAIKINPNYAEAYYFRAFLYTRTSQYLLADEDYNKLKILNPEKKDYYEYLSFYNNNSICNWKEHEVTISKIENQLKNKNNIDFLDHIELLLYTDSLDIIYNNVENSNNFLHKIHNIKSLNKFRNNYNNKKIKIAYYSSDFRYHPVSQLLISILENHNKKKFEVYGFHFSEYNDDEMTKNISKKFDIFNNVTKDLDLKIINQSKDYKIDIAIDLAGHTGDARPSLFMKRVAPVQINFLGYAGTVGPYMDYIVADKYLIPSQNKKFYFEKIIYMPDCFISVDPKIFNNKYDRKKFNLPESKFLYCCLSNPHKITPYIFSSWMKILKNTKDTVICFLYKDDSSKKNLIREAKKEGIDESRIIFCPKINYEDIFSRYKLMDLFLDTFPYTSHAVATDVLSSGLPILTISGNSFHSRVTASLLASLKIPELITKDIKDYENIAINFANNKEKIIEIKKKLNCSIINTNTFNTKNYTNNLEMAFELAHKQNKQTFNLQDIFIN